jgi:uncharacterized protein YbjT (DUF2867 family)
MALRTALVVGASGLVGGHCLNALLDDPRYSSVTALGRRTIRGEHPTLHQYVIDFDRPDEYQHLAGADDLFCCLGTTIKKAGSREAFYKVDVTYPLAIAQAALANGAQQLLIVSALGANPRAAAFYNRVKGDVEMAVSKLRFRAVHIFRPSLLVGHREEFRPAERLAQLLAAPLSVALVGPLRRYRPIDASAVAVCMVKIANQGLEGIHVYESEQIQSC